MKQHIDSPDHLGVITLASPVTAAVTGNVIGSGKLDCDDVVVECWEYYSA